MKQLYVLSDTHGWHGGFEAFKGIAGNVEIAHLGDYGRDAAALADILGRPVHAVRGNCDMSNDYPLRETLYIEDKKIIIMHGHTHYVKYSLDRLVYQALEDGADCILYGHTHIPDVRLENGILLLCPGAFGKSCASYARLTIDKGLITPELLTL